MEGHEVALEIIEFYTSAYDEGSRLSRAAHGVLEFARTRELLRRHLPAAPATVLDVGGGPGTHARWLAADGHRVHLIDPVERHVREALASCRCTAELGDARSLPAAGGSYDVALLLGPLYHLTERTERDRALREARRVLRPRGLLAAAAINRHALLLDMAAMAILDAPTVRLYRAVLAAGRYDGKHGFTVAYFHTAEEFRAELTAAGFADVRLYGVEGPSWPALKAVQTHTGESLVDSPLLASALTAARTAESVPELLAASAHFLAVARPAR